jgi:hypothetical protein
MEGSERQERIARNEATFRRVNEALEPRDAADGDVLRFVCECGRLGCTETLALRRADYEAVRTAFDRFLLLPGHQDAETDAVVEDHGAYLVVVKQGEPAGRIADEEDPRGGEVAGR